jgi:uncharacterized protein (DUF1330 family)
MSETYLHPSQEQMLAIRDMELDGPVIMLNLLKFNPDGGADEYSRYGSAAGNHLQKAGARVRLLANVAATVIGGEDWDRMILVEYPSKQAFLEMSSSSDYPSEIRANALLDSRLICTQAAGDMTL